MGLIFATTTNGLKIPRKPIKINRNPKKRYSLVLKLLPSMALLNIFSAETVPSCNNSTLFPKTPKPRLIIKG